MDEIQQLNWKEIFCRTAQPMLSIVLLLRYTQVLEQVGPWTTLAIMFLIFLVTFVTQYSTFIFVTHSKEEHGFLRTVISLSSPEFGTSFSILYIFCSILAVALFISAASEAILHVFSLRDIVLIDAAVNDLRIVGAGLSVLLLALCAVRIAHASLLRFFVFCLSLLLTATQVSSFMFHYGNYQLHRVNNENGFIETPDVSKFCNALAVLFPASMCALSLLNFNAKLQKNAQKGALLAVLLATTIYLSSAFFDWATVFSNRSYNGTELFETEKNSYPFISIVLSVITVLACLTSALSFLKFGSRTLQHVSRCGNFSKLVFLSRGFGDNDIPLRALTAMHIAVVGVMLTGSYDVICIPTTCFFLVAYAVFNFHTFRSKLNDTGSDLPTAYLSIFTAFLCLLLSVLVNSYITLGAVTLFGVTYAFLLNDLTDKGGEGKVSSYSPTLRGMLALHNEQEDQRKYRPQILVLTGNPASRPALVDFAHCLTKDRSLLITGHVVHKETNTRNYLLTQKLEKQMSEWLESREVDAFPIAICNTNRTQAVSTLLQTVGLGRLRPNVLMLGFKKNWRDESVESIFEYYRILSNAFEKQVGTAILRNTLHGFDVCTSIKKHNGTPINGDDELSDYLDSTNTSVRGHAPKKVGSNRTKIIGALRKMSRIMIAGPISETDPELAAPPRRHKFEVVSSKHSISEPDQKAIISQMHRFRKRVYNGRIDVYWLRASGGLTMYAPYLVAQTGSWLEGAKIRVFTKSDGDKVSDEQKMMAQLLRKLNIDTSDVHILHDFDRSPSKLTTDHFHDLIEPFRKRNGEEAKPGMISDEDLLTFKEKTRHFLRASEIMREQSSDADLIVATCPSARSEIPAALYVAWVDMLSRQNAPTLLIRGNKLGGEQEHKISV